jgi:hypothetical protein
MTTDVDILELAKMRVDSLRREHRDISLDYIVQYSPFGNWAIILYHEYDFSLTGFDIIESRNSWRRPDAVEEYNALVDDGYCVVVYVPDEVKGEAAKMIREKNGRENIRLRSIEKILPMIMTRQ